MKKKVVTGDDGAKLSALVVWFKEFGRALNEAVTKMNSQP
jgi:hypothetical protein